MMIRQLEDDDDGDNGEDDITDTCAIKGT